MKLPLQSAPASLCILRLSAIGDVTHVVPIIRTLQKVWPSTKITWIIGKAEAALVGDIEGIEFIIFDKSEGRRAYSRLYSSLSGRRFDILLHMQAALRASIASLLIRAEIKVGFDNARERDFQGWFIDTRITGNNRVHVVDTFFQFLEKAGIDERTLSWDIPLSSDDIAFAKNTLGDRETLIINPCTSVRANNWRNWGIDRYARVIDHAIETHGLNIVLTGGPATEEREFGEAIASQTKHAVNNMIGCSSLKQLQAILSMARVVIAPDTGPAHMAAATGVPVIGLYASSNPERTGPYSSLEWTVNKYPEALKKFNDLDVDSAAWGKRVRAPDVMDIITVADVVNMIDKVMSEKAKN